MGEKPRRRSDSIVDASQNTHRRRGCGEFDRAFDADLAFELRPAKAEGGARMGGEIAAFGIGGVGIKNKSVRIVVLKSDHAAGGLAGGFGVGEGHGGGIGWFVFMHVGEPGLK